MSKNVVTRWTFWTVFFWMVTVSFAAFADVTASDTPFAEKPAGPARSHTKDAATDIAILYFANHTSQKGMDILQKGISLLLTHDLKKIKSLSVVPRETIEALLQEDGTSVANLEQTRQAIQLGKKLNVTYLVTGRISRQDAEQYAFQARIIHVPSETVKQTVSSQGRLFTQLRQMEKTLLFQITQALNIKTSPQEQAELKQTFYANTDSLLAYLNGVSFQDQNQFETAAKYFTRALQSDPKNQAAAMAMQQMTNQGLIVAKAAQPGEAEAYSETERQPEVTKGGTRYDTRNPEDREPESPLTFNTLEEDVDVQIEEENVPLSVLHIRTDATWDMAVDPSSLQTALDHTAGSPDLTSLIDNRAAIPGEFSQTGSTMGFPGSWQAGSTGAADIYGDGATAFGLQTLGQNGYDGTPTLLLNADTLAKVNQDGFLAYAIQVEEDRLNKKIMEMHDDRIIQSALYQADQFKGIRDRDAWLTQAADAQAGRVLKDADGNWVRVQQYILRPDTQTVQMLNVSLRGGTSDQTGLSTMNWTTTFSEAYTGDLRNLPWTDWLNTRETTTGGSPVRYVAGNSSNKPPLLQDMRITFTNPGQENLANQRSFAAGYMDSGPGYKQEITEETLQIQTAGNSTTYRYTTDTLPKADQFTLSAAASSADGFSYQLGNQADPLEIGFAVLGDGNTVENRGIRTEYQGTLSFQDMWDVMRVNETGGLSIGNSNLEIRIDPEKRYYQDSIDAIFIPMSRMVWKSEP